MIFSDDDILRRVQGGARDEYLTLYDRHYPRLERYARRQLQDGEAARDIASETFLRAYRSVDTFRIGESCTYLGYLLLICHRLILTEQAHRRDTPTRSLDTAAPEAEHIADPSPSPMRHALDCERRAMLHRALDTLPASDREIIHLAFERDLSRQDVAQILNKPSVSAVTSHLHRAMQKLRAILIRQEYFTAETAPEPTSNHAAER